MKRLIIFFMLISFISSCSDFLEQEPGDQTSINEVFKDYKGFKMALNGCYYELEELCTSEGTAVYADLMGGNIAITPWGVNYQVIVSPMFDQVYSFNDMAQLSSIGYIYNDGYDIVNAVNILLEKLEELEGVTNEQISQLRAESLAIRGFAHFCLAKFYSQNYAYKDDASHPGIVYNTKTLEAGVDYPTRKTVKETYKLIITDLEEALKSFSENNVLEGYTYSYFNIHSCKALLAKVALYGNDYQRAIDYSTDVIDNSGVVLMSKEEYAEEWKKPETPVSEIIMELSAKVDDEGDFKLVNSMSAHYGTFPDLGYHFEYSANVDLLNLFEDEDIRGVDFMYIRDSIKTIVIDEVEPVKIPYFFTCKFQDNSGNPLFRLSEQYLIRSEAYMRLNDKESALADLNEIRYRAGATPATLEDDLLEEIFLERRRELCFEGHLFFDIARFQKNVVRKSNCVATACNLDYPSDYFVLPIPKRNVDLNSNLIQNDGY